MDKKFRTHGPDELKQEYHELPSVEAAYSFLKTQYSMATNKVRGETWSVVLEFALKRKGKFGFEDWFSVFLTIVRLLQLL